MPIRVNGLRELLRVTDQLPRIEARGVRNQLRLVAEPIRQEATELFLARVSPDPRKVRYGISVRKAGTITVEERKRRTTGKHPEFGARQMKLAMILALERHQAETVRRLDSVFDDLERRWARP